MEITTPQLLLTNQSEINASTAAGDGGNLNLNLSELVYLRNFSQLTAAAGGTGNGGNIMINAPIILGLENSDIVANAVGGRGGFITITTQGIIGLAFRNTVTPRTDITNDITASSEFSVNGNVRVNTIGINPAATLNALPHEIVDSSRQIADRCDAAKTSSFIATGRGGMPQDPIKKKGSDRTWNDLRPLVETTPIATQPTVNSQPLIEASALEVDQIGSISLVAAKLVGSKTAATCGMGDSN